MPRSTASPLEKMTRKFKWAFANYMESEREWNRNAFTTYTVIHRTMGSDVSIPTHIKTEFLEMAAELKKQWECPVCLEFIQSDQLEITPCGHKYCKECVAKLRETTKQCAVCRRSWER